MTNKSRLLALIGVSCFIAGCVEQETGNQTMGGPPTVEATVGQQFVIMLPSNPTTGHSWRLAESPPDVLKLTGREYKTRRGGKGMVGAGGVEQWTFTPLARGKVTLAFEYVRPWEKDTTPEKRQTFAVNIR